MGKALTVCQPSSSLIASLLLWRISSTRGWGAWHCSSLCITCVPLPSASRKSVLAAINSAAHCSMEPRVEQGVTRETMVCFDGYPSSGDAGHFLLGCAYGPRQLTDLSYMFSAKTSRCFFSHLPLGPHVFADPLHRIAKLIHLPAARVFRVRRDKVRREITESAEPMRIGRGKARVVVVQSFVRIRWHSCLVQLINVGWSALYIHGAPTVFLVQQMCRREGRVHNYMQCQLGPTESRLMPVRITWQAYPCVATYLSGFARALSA